jgi:hypothetical protein
LVVLVVLGAEEDAVQDKAHIAEVATDAAALFLAACTEGAYAGTNYTLCRVSPSNPSLVLLFRLCR